MTMLPRTPEARDYQRYVSSQRLTAWEGIISEWMFDLLARRLQSLRHRLTEVWTPEERAVLRAENAEVGRRARLDTFIWPEYLTAPTLPYSLEGKSAERDYLVDADRWKAEVADEGAALFERIFERAESSMVQERRKSPTSSLFLIPDPLPGSNDVTGSLDRDSLVNSPGVRSVLADRLQWALGSTENRVNQILDSVLAPENEGEDLADVWNRVKGTRPQRQVWSRVAGNALAAATVNAAALEAAILNGVTYKQWLSSKDDRVRFTHRAPMGDGQTVGIRESFLIGGIPMQYPGDPIAFKYGKRGMAQVYGCRCTMAFHHPDDDADTGVDPPFWAIPLALPEGVTLASNSTSPGRPNEDGTPGAGGVPPSAIPSAPVRYSPDIALEWLAGALNVRIPRLLTLRTLARMLGAAPALLGAAIAAVEAWFIAEAMGDVVASAGAAAAVLARASDAGLTAAQVGSIEAALR
jgi:hypothetical protein